MNNQIRELITLIKALADQITSNKTNSERIAPINKETYTKRRYFNSVQ